MSDTGSQHQTSGALVPKTHSRWEKAEIIGKIAGSLLPAIFLAAIGLFGHYYTQSLENSRLYTELLTQREQADTALRKDMFKVLIGEFLSTADGNGASPSPSAAASPMHETETVSDAKNSSLEAAINANVEAISDQLLKIELLALNFSESLALSPLFHKLDVELDQLIRQIDPEHTGAGPIKIINRINILNKRLVSLARRVSQDQIAAIKALGVAFRITVPYAKADGYSWPYDNEAYSADTGGVELPMGRMECGSVVRQIQVDFSVPDITGQGVLVDLTVTKVGDVDNKVQPLFPSSLFRGQVVEEPQAVKKSFKLNFFNFPLVDNTRLSDDQRFALVLTDFDEREIETTVLCFSGAHSSVRDRPFLNEAIERLSE
jgi:hypothetical protein